ncbi:hypothetical protein BAY61_20535 [Prauserella marina]|uniref:Uncharacterized protein n=1 Tax=Prauserella marina TaxID=530584 RepID=A0A222VTC6_9PSEU|nr:hypothetical protein [Prauserella marina]ASR36971.1 hypothetical protein BAY61_20535 [Prauserella marina]PWV80065.1 hypothetical protein DES30_103151 [Prauserella marina]SDD83971.1 hypothetical protein SAMN05421630_11366 [Prauserella marina]
MANPTRRTHTPGTIIATMLLVICGALLGAWLASLYDVFRVGALDNALANQLGYIGEITDASIDPLPHGIPRGGLIVMLLVGLVGGLITYAVTAVSRRSINDPEAVAYACGAVALGIGAGFGWLSTGWPTVEHEPENGFAAFIGFGNIWVPVVLAGIAALCLLVWWVHPETDEKQDETTTPGAPNTHADGTS